MLLVSGVQQSDSEVCVYLYLCVCVCVCVCVFFFIFFSTVVCYKMLNIVPCAVQ